MDYELHDILLLAKRHARCLQSHFYRRRIERANRPHSGLIQMAFLALTHTKTLK